MVTSVTETGKECPFFMPSRPMPGGAGVAVGIYCRLPGGRVRVPSRVEATTYCLPGRHEECPVYLRHDARG